MRNSDSSRSDQDVAAARGQNARAIALEQRMLLDAAAARTAHDVLHAPHTHTDLLPRSSSPVDSGHARYSSRMADPRHATGTLSPDGHHPFTTLAVERAAREASLLSPPSHRQPTEAVFIDTSIPDYQSLLPGISHDAVVYFIDGSKDGLAQMAADLAGTSTKFQSIQIYSHGADAEFRLGSSLITLDTVNSHAADFAAIGSHLVSGGDLMLYGCNIAAQDDGKLLVNEIAGLTGAHVAASTDATGSTKLGGNWNLEYSTGTITAHSALSTGVQHSYASLLTLGWTDVTSVINSDYAANTQLGWSVAESRSNGWIAVAGNRANIAGTYSQSGTTVTVTSNAQTGVKAGQTVYLTLSGGTGGATTGSYTVASVVDATHFTVTSGTSATTSGNATTTSYGDNVYVYMPTGGGQYTETKITAPALETGVSSVAIDGNYVIVGYPNANTAYIFNWNGSAWSQVASLSGSGSFGFSVAIEATGGVYRALVGAPNYNGGAGAGQGGVFTWYSSTGATWTAGTTITTTDGYYDTQLNFGYAVAISGNDVVIGAPGWGYHTYQSSYYVGSNGNNTDNQNIGRAYLLNWTGAAGISYTANTFALVMEPDGVEAPEYSGSGTYFGNVDTTANPNDNGAPAGIIGARFGSSVSVSVNGTYQYIAAGSPNEAGNGEAYTFTNTAGTWGNGQDLVPGLAAGSQFGASVAIDAYTGRLAVGAPGMSSNNGGVFTYTVASVSAPGAWTVDSGTATTPTYAGSGAGQWGQSVALAKDMLVFGLPLNNLNSNAVDSGLAAIKLNNKAPTPANDTASTTESSAVTVNVLANDTDPNDVNIDPLAVISVSAPSKGSAVINANYTITYNPNGAYNYLSLGQTATETLTYTVKDGGGEVKTATLTITINGQENPITLVSTPSGEHGNAAQTTTYALPSGTFADQDLADTDTYGFVMASTWSQSATTITVTTPSANGLAVGNPVYLNFTSGSGTLPTSQSYIVQSVSGNTFTVTSATSQTASGAVNSGTRSTSLTILNTTSTAGSSLTFTLNSSTGAMTFSPPAGFAGYDYTIPGIAVSDGSTSSYTAAATAAFNVHIDRTNVAPTATAGTATVAATESSTVSQSMTGYFSDADFSQPAPFNTEALTYSLVAQSGGTVPNFLAISPTTGVLTGTPGEADVTSSGTYSQSGTTITVTAQNNYAVGSQVYLNIGSGTTTSGWYTVATASASSFTVTSGASATTSGSVAMPDQFIVRATDQFGLTADKVVQVSVANINDAPNVIGSISGTQAYIGSSYTDTTAGALINIGAPASSTLFQDPDWITTPNPITYSAKFANGNALGTAGVGSWLTFDATTGIFYGTPNDPIGTILSVVVTATDSGGLSTSYTFSISVFPAPQSGGYASGTSPADSTSFGNMAGYNVAVSEDGLWMAVGEPGYDLAGSANNGYGNIGRVSIYDWSGTAWTLVTRLADPNNTAGDRFGYSLDWNQTATELIVGAPGVNSNAGTVYSWTRSAGTTTFTAATTYTAADNNAGDMFGFSVSLNRAGTQLVVGAPGDSGTAYGAAGTAANNSGAVYLANWGTAAPVAKQTSIVDTGDTTQVGNEFGWSVSFTGGLVAVGSPFDSSNGLYDNGSVTVLGVGASAFGTGTNITKKYGANSFDLFGWSVALDTYRYTTTSAADSSVMLVVGAPDVSMALPNTTTVVTQVGAVYTYRLENQASSFGTATNWSTTPLALMSTDTAYDGTSYDHFGTSVAIDIGSTAANFANNVKDNGVRMVVGSELSGTNPGSVYVYHEQANSTWLGQKYLQNNSGLTTPSPTTNQFGYSVAISEAPTSAWNAAYAVATSAAKVVAGAPNTYETVAPATGSGINGPAGAVYSWSTAGTLIENTGTYSFYSGNIDKMLSLIDTSVRGNPLFLQEEQDAGGLLTGYVDQLRKRDDGYAVPVSQFFADLADVDPRQLLLMTPDSTVHARAETPPADAKQAPAGEKATGKQGHGLKDKKAAPDKQAVPEKEKAGKDAKPVGAKNVEPAVGTALSRQLQQLSSRHHAQAADFVGRLASLNG